MSNSTLIVHLLYGQIFAIRNFLKQKKVKAIEIPEMVDPHMAFAVISSVIKDGKLCEMGDCNYWQPPIGITVYQLFKSKNGWAEYFMFRDRNRVERFLRIQGQSIGGMSVKGLPQEFWNEMQETIKDAPTFIPIGDQL